MVINPQGTPEIVVVVDKDCLDLLEGLEQFQHSWYYEYPERENVNDYEIGKIHIPGFIGPDLYTPGLILRVRMVPNIFKIKAFDAQ